MDIILGTYKKEIQMKIMNKDFGNRLWGASIVLWLLVCTNGNYALWIRVLSAIIVTYFFMFGNSRFDEEYKKII
jgi:hypothetical protein